MKISILDYKNFRAGSAWIILIMGIALYGVGYFYVDDNSIWKEILIKLGDVLVFGVILGYLYNASQFLGIFKKDLQDIIYGKEFLRTRTDIQPLWDNISKELFKNKFPKIHKDLLDTVSGYLPKDEVSFYDDYEAHLKIEWQNKDMGIISVTDGVLAINDSSSLNVGALLKIDTAEKKNKVMTVVEKNVKGYGVFEDKVYVYINGEWIEQKEQ